MKKRIIILLFISIFFGHVKAQNINDENTSINTPDKFENSPDSIPLKLALKGYDKLTKEGKLNKKVITIIDLSKSSNEKRLWVIDIHSSEIKYTSLVAHGKNSGNKFATSFSNTPQSYKSSLGFYVTGSTYQGKHGLSLRLNGQEKGINDNARKRAIVMHGANYVSKKFVKKHGRLGRSFGCPALPLEKHKQIIEFIKEGSCLFIYFPDNNYIKNSNIL